MNNDLFSVIITVYNKEKYIYNSLKSIYCQTFSPLEIIIVNDGSTDRSLFEISKIKDSRVKVYTIENKGVSFARNFGASQAKGSYLAFLDGDDIWLENHLEEIHKMIGLFPNESVFSSAALNNKKGRSKKYKYSVSIESVKAVNYFQASLLQSVLNSSSFVICTDLYRKMGGFNVRYANYEDIDFWFRLGLEYSVVFSIKPTVIIRETTKSLSRNKINLETCCFFEQYDNVDVSNKVFYKVLDLNRYSLALICKEYGEQEKFNLLKSKINRNHLSYKNKVLLSSPAFIIKLLRRVKETLC